MIRAVAEDTVDWSYTKRQQIALDCLSDARREIKEVLYGGAKGGGKSVLGCRWILHKCDALIAQFDLAPTPTPPQVGFMGRKQGVDFNDTTLETLKREWPGDYYRINKVDKEIIIDDTVKIAFGGFDSQESINKFNSAEFAFAFIDQAEELTLEDAGLLRGTMRAKINDRDVVRKILWTANPRRGWLKDEFVDREKTNQQYRFVQALPGDNRHLPSDYMDTLERAFKYRPELLAAYRDGSWEAFEDPQQILFERHIKQAHTISRSHQKDVLYIVIDPARFGDDETVMYLCNCGNIVDQKIFGKIPSDRLNLVAHAWAIEQKCVAVVIDEGGLGGPVVDWQRNMAGGAYQVIGLNSSDKPADDEQYFNLRAEMYMQSAALIAAGEIPLTTQEWMDEDDYRILVNQLCGILFDFRGKRIIVESKTEIKKPDRLGCSPDRGDCAIMAWYVWPRVQRLSARRPVGKKKIRWNQKKPRNAWSM